MKDRCLFKAKICNEEWVAGFLHCKNDKWYISNKAGSPFAFEVRPDTICQCTGLTDKNGNLIWENDVVEFFGHKGVIVCECGSFGIAYKTLIDWEEIQSNIKCVTGCENILYACENDNFISLWEICWNFNDEDNSLCTVEIAGNIFDNPELIKER